VKLETEEPLKLSVKPESPHSLEITDTFAMPMEMDSISVLEILTAPTKLPQDHLSSHALLELNADVETRMRNAQVLLPSLLAIILTNIKPTPLEPLEPPEPLEQLEPLLDNLHHHHRVDVPIMDSIATTMSL